MKKTDLAERYASAQPIPEWGTLKRFAVVFLMIIFFGIVSVVTGQKELGMMFWGLGAVAFVIGIALQYRFNRAYYRYWTAQGWTRQQIGEEFRRMFPGKGGF